ncbi:DUF2071 domain-containing protein [Rhodopirellula sp.]|nr:DUF2071 domain-containing protein [Rhodopirellula sp.]MDB4678881.1 DUF2071 domain-containing protein [Rhodopirellula sp.]MDC0295317.1 DUF2071 domain-containing protein [bacterium]
MPFLQASWQDLVMVNWEVSPDLLTPLMPEGCSLDFFEGKTFVSLVAFLFKETRVLGMKIPAHVNFEEVNLRFYVKHETDQGEQRRGVVFVKEFVPRRLIAWTARNLYQEPYSCLPMSHLREKQTSGQTKIRYQWGDHWLSGLAGSESKQLEVGSLQHFIAEHYWGYTSTKGGTRQYRVDHPTWRWRSFDEFQSKIDFVELYGEKWTFLGQKEPTNLFLAVGSEVSVSPWGRL